MKPAFSLVRHDPPRTYGDCHRACIASLMEIATEDVPHFAADFASGPMMKERTQNWLHDRGLYLLDFVYSCELKELFQFVKATNPRVYYILGGNSPIGSGHSTICIDDTFAHDPCGSTIVAPFDDGLYWISFLGSFEPRYWRTQEERINSVIRPFGDVPIYGQQ